METQQPTHGPLMTIHASLALDEYLEAALNPFKKKHNRLVLANVVGCVVFLGLGLFFYFTGGSTSGLTLLVIALILGSIGLSLKRNIRSQLSDLYHRNPRFSDENEITLSPEGFRERTMMVDLLVRWHGFTHFTESALLFYLHRGFADALVIPKRVLKDEAAISELRGVLMHYIGRTSVERAFPVQPVTPTTASTSA